MSVCLIGQVLYITLLLNSHDTPTSLPSTLYFINDKLRIPELSHIKANILTGTFSTTILHVKAKDGTLTLRILVLQTHVNRMAMHISWGYLRAT